jgi:threonine dehydratase
MKLFSSVTLFSFRMLQVVVKEEWIAIAILRLVELEKCVVEGAGAAGLAAILAGHLNELKGKKSVAVNYE